jgi:hypothetical protein
MAVIETSANDVSLDELVAHGRRFGEGVRVKSCDGINWLVSSKVSIRERATPFKL